MKKLFMLVCAAVISISASAQQGEKAIGVNLSYGSEINNIGLGVKGQYSFTNEIRGEASFDYFPKKDGVSMWDINANLHYLFNAADKVKVYPLAGLGYTNWDVKADLGEFGSVKTSTSKLAVNLGGGVEYALSDKMSINTELKYQIIDNYNQLVVGVGFACKF